jgi:hypothetical protein
MLKVHRYNSERKCKQVTGTLWPCTSMTCHLTSTAHYRLCTIVYDMHIAAINLKCEPTQQRIVSVACIRTKRQHNMCSSRAFCAAAMRSSSAFSAAFARCSSAFRSSAASRSSAAFHSSAAFRSWVAFHSSAAFFCFHRFLLSLRFFICLGLSHLLNGPLICLLPRQHEAMLLVLATRKPEGGLPLTVILLASFDRCLDLFCLELLCPAAICRFFLRYPKSLNKIARIFPFLVAFYYLWSPTMLSNRRC